MKTAPAPEMPKRLVARLQRQSVALLEPVRQMAAYLLEQERLAQEPPADGALRADAAIISGAMSAELARVLVGWLRTVITPEQAQQVAQQQVATVAKFGRVAFENWARAAGIDPRDANASALTAAAIEERIKANAKWIASISEQLADQVAEEVNKALLQGSTPGLGSILQERLGVAESRARLIARDQAATAQGQIQKVRQQALGVRRYRWQTAGDERVRPSHAALNGQAFTWDAPPPIGHPGEPINCRCVAIPIFDDD